MDEEKALCSKDSIRIRVLFTRRLQSSEMREHRAGGKHVLSSTKLSLDGDRRDVLMVTYSAS